MSEPRSAVSRGRLLFVAANPSIDRLYEVDRLALGDIHRPRSSVVVPGGKGLNAARAAATLGGSVTAVGIVAGRAGDWIVERLAQLGIDARMARSGGETRTCFSILDRSTGALTELYERGEEVEPRVWQALETIVLSELERGDVATIAFSGSLPAGVPADGYARIARIAAAASPPVPVLVDTYGPALAAVLGENPAVVKVNAAEAGEAAATTVSDAFSASEAADAVRNAGASSVVVTLGVAGAVVVNAGAKTRLVPPDISGPYPVGSGDAFIAGLAVSLARGEEILEAARLGMAAGIANAQTPGAGEIDLASVEGILAQIETMPV